ncbi:MAG: acyl-CoA dehydrogenase [Myxococcota bacterium]|nr:acyl-CoA dehydrogenase [Myxococcota bacterium]
MAHEFWRAGASLDEFLGDPYDPRNAISHEAMVTLDEAERFPEDACRMLDTWGLSEYYIPTFHGGRLAGHDELLALLWAISRRDLTVAIAHGKTFLGAVAIWVAGSSSVRERLARIIRGGGAVALDLTERDHGSDLSANEVTAAALGDRFSVSGTKWLVNNATRGRAITLFARTEPRGGPRGFSLFLVDKEALAAGSYETLPKIRTHGIRGADISGLCFRDAPVGRDSLIGDLGAGLDITIRSLQITRTLCSGLSLGAMEAAIRLVLRFAETRRLYDTLMIELPFVRQELVVSLVDLLGAECLSLSATRAIHVLGRQMSVTSAVVKYLVPTIAERVVARLAVVLGARHYLRESFAGGVFQKLLRDNALVGLFDGSTVVNLQALASQLPSLFSERPPHTSVSEQVCSEIGGVFSFRSPLPAFDPQTLCLTSRGRHSYLEALPGVAERIPAHGEAARARAAKAGRAIEAQVDRLGTQIRAVAGRDRGGFARSTEAFGFARRYCTWYAAAACLHGWVHNGRQPHPFWVHEDWVPLWVHLALEAETGSGFLSIEEKDEAVASLAGGLLRAYRENVALSLFPYRLATATAAHGQPSS